MHSTASTVPNNYSAQNVNGDTVEKPLALAPSKTQEVGLRRPILMVLYDGLSWENNITIKDMDTEARLPGFKSNSTSYMSYYLTFLRLTFLLHKMGTEQYPPYKAVVRIK